jgi:hypothetical protein
MLQCSGCVTYGLSGAVIIRKKSGSFLFFPGFIYWKPTTTKGEKISANVIWGINVKRKRRKRKKKRRGKLKGKLNAK